MIKPKLDPEVVHNVTDLLAAAIHIDRYMMDAMERLDEDFAELNTLTMETFKQLSRSKHALHNKILNDKQAPGESVTRNLEEITLYNKQMEEITNSPISRLQRLCACCDRSFAFYQAIIDTTADEAIKSTAQNLASSAFDRIGVLRQALGKECGCDD